MNRKREPYDEPKIFFDSTEEFDWFPVKVKKRHHKTWRQRARNLAANILRHYERQKLADEDAERRKRAAEILERVAKDKVLLALEKAFDERVAEIQQYYLSEHEKEAKAGDKRRRGELAKILKRINQDTCRLERAELSRRGVVRGRR